MVAVARYVRVRFCGPSAVSRPRCTPTPVSMTLPTSPCKSPGGPSSQACTGTCAPSSSRVPSLVTDEQEVSTSFFTFSITLLPRYRLVPVSPLHEPSLDDTQPHAHLFEIEAPRGRHRLEEHELLQCGCAAFGAAHHLACGLGWAQSWTQCSDATGCRLCSGSS